MLVCNREFSDGAVYKLLRATSRCFRDNIASMRALVKMYGCMGTAHHMGNFLHGFGVRRITTVIDSVEYCSLLFEHYWWGQLIKARLIYSNRQFISFRQYYHTLHIINFSEGYEASCNIIIIESHKTDGIRLYHNYDIFSRECGEEHSILYNILNRRAKLGQVKDVLYNMRGPSEHDKKRAWDGEILPLYRYEANLI
jgi:hypothetical protein